MPNLGEKKTYYQRKEWTRSAEKSVDNDFGAIPKK